MAPVLQVRSLKVFHLARYSTFADVNFGEAYSGICSLSRALCGVYPMILASSIRHGGQWRKHVTGKEMFRIKPSFFFNSFEDFAKQEENKEKMCTSNFCFLPRQVYTYKKCETVHVRS